MNSIYEYTNYHIYLKAYYDEKKATTAFFSYQYFADKCEFKSKTYLYKVIKGEKALTVSSALKIGAFMNLKKNELHYFESIVMFTNAKTIKEKEFYFEKLQKYSKRSGSSLLRQHQYEYFNKWYNSVIREIVAVVDWKNDYAVLAKAVLPAITPREAKNSVELLLDLGLIKSDDNGNYFRTERSVTTGDDIVSIAVNHFQKENLKLATAAIDRFPRNKRDISTLTMSIPSDAFERIQLEIAQFRKKLIGIVESYETVDQVYQINFQAFPLSRSPKEIS